jgi:hypothetical protein
MTATQWPEYEWHELEMSAVPTSSLEAEVARAWKDQVGP